ncbi:MAG: Na+/H+ antiporter NhaC family protein, partial [Clostridia bacterium]|nr:Na+/H+ antiporter NhaC family protein [Clostridia bacterium]
AQGLIPAIMFLVAVGLAFSTGTSWGTFGILVPIILGIFITPETPDLTQLGIISISACLAGAVCGDHISPISDTTIMASTGAQCNHINHVSTQIPYAMLVAGVSFVGYLLSAFIRSAVILLPICIVLLIAVLFVIKGYYARKKNV